MLTSISALVMVFDSVFGFMGAVMGVYDVRQRICHRTPGTVGNLRSRGFQGVNINLCTGDGF